MTYMMTRASLPAARMHAAPLSRAARAGRAPGRGSVRTRTVHRSPYHELVPAARRSRFASFPDTAAAAFHGLGGLTIGPLAKRDFVMSTASLTASNILRQATAEKTAAAQLRVIRAALNKVQPGLAQQFDQKMAAGRGRDLQSVFNAMRLVIANSYASQAIEQIKIAVANAGGTAEGLGATDYTGSDVACAIMSGGSVLTSLIGAGTHTTVSTDPLNTAGNNFCGARTADNLRDQTAQQTAQTAANLQIAAMQAQQHQADLAAQATQGETTIKLVMIGGGVLLAGLIGFAVIKKI